MKYPDKIHGDEELPENAIQTGINSMKIDNVEYGWSSPSFKGDWFGWYKKATPKK